MGLLNITKDPLPLLYDRLTKYGVPAKGHIFNGTEALAEALEKVRKDLDRIGWLPHIEAFLSGGTQVDKGKPDNAHRTGNAIDFDGFLLKPNPFAYDEIQGAYVYENGHASSVRDGSKGTTLFIKSIEQKAKTRFACLLSRHFGTVLGDFYDKNHADHLHCDVKRSVRWRGSKSQMNLLRAVNDAWEMPARLDIFNEHVITDKIWPEFLDMMTFNPPRGSE